MVKALLHRTVKGDNALSLFDKGFNNDSIADMPFTKVECLANTEINKICVFITIETEMEMPAMVKCDQLYYMKDIDLKIVSLDDRFFSEPRWAKKVVCLEPKGDKA